MDDLSRGSLVTSLNRVIIQRNFLEESLQRLAFGTKHQMPQNSLQYMLLWNWIVFIKEKDVSCRLLWKSFLKEWRNSLQGYIKRRASER